PLIIRGLDVLFLRGTESVSMEDTFALAGHSDKRTDAMLLLIGPGMDRPSTGVSRMPVPGQIRFRCRPEVTALRMQVEGWLKKVGINIASTGIVVTVNLPNG